MITQKQDIDFVDSSRLCCFKRCPRMFLYKCLMGLVSPTQIKIYMNYGTCIHTAIPYTYSGNIQAAYDAFDKQWAEFGHGEMDEARNTTCAHRSLLDFAMSHTKEKCLYEIIKLELPNVKKRGLDAIPFMIDVGAHYPLAGEMDCAVKWKQDGSLWPLDYKTSGEVSGRLFENFEFSCQSLAYSLALSHICNQSASGMIVEAIRVSKVRAENLMHLVFIKPHQTRDFIDFVIRTCDEIKLCNDTGIWPKNPTGCAPYSMFGTPGYYCPYKLICDQPDWKDGLKFFTKEKPHSPYEMEVIK